MPQLTPWPIADYVICGTIGAVLYILSAKFLWDQDDKWWIPAIRRLIAGPLLGLVVYIFGLPNSVTALTAGYVGIDWLEGILQKVKTKVSTTTPANKGLTWLTLLGVIAGAIIAAGGLFILLIDLPTGVTDPVGWLALILGLILAIGSGYVGRPK